MPAHSSFKNKVHFSLHKASCRTDQGPSHANWDILHLWLGPQHWDTVSHTCGAYAAVTVHAALYL